MDTLITKEEVVALAFADGEYLSPDAIGESDIALAEHRYILPIVGDALYTELLGGMHPTLQSEYLLPALAMAVRSVVQPSLNVRTGQAGLIISTSLRADSSTKSAMSMLQRSINSRRRALLKRLSHYLKNHASEFPAYNARRDAMQRCSIDGGYVQTR